VKSRHTIPVLAIGVLLAVPGVAGATTPPSPAGFSFTDDSGATIELDEVPSRIVMFEDVAASLMDLGVRPVGLDHLDPENELLDDFDLEGVEPVSSGCMEQNLEAIAALEPDLFVYMNWGDSDGTGNLFCLDEAVRRELERFAPVVVINAEGAADEILERYVDLAEALGADLDAPEIVAKRERYEAAADRLRTAIEDRPEISVLPASVSPEWAGVAEIGGFADLVTLRDTFGLTLVSPFPIDEYTATYWQEYTAETLPEIRGDVVLLDAKNSVPMDEKLAAFPLWAALPEIEARQTVDWWVPGSFSYTRDAEFMESLAAAIEDAEDFVTEA
jgi:iron complex transport system substrate-binding protein